MSWEDDEEDEVDETFVEATIDALPPRVALAYSIIRDPCVSDKGLRHQSKSVLMQYLTGERDG